MDRRTRTGRYALGKLAEYKDEVTGEGTVVQTQELPVPSGGGRLRLSNILHGRCGMLWTQTIP